LRRFALAQEFAAQIDQFHGIIGRLGTRRFLGGRIRQACLWRWADRCVRGSRAPGSGWPCVACLELLTAKKMPAVASNATGTTPISFRILSSQGIAGWCRWIFFSASLISCWVMRPQTTQPSRMDLNRSASVLIVAGKVDPESVPRIRNHLLSNYPQQAPDAPTGKCHLPLTNEKPVKRQIAGAPVHWTPERGLQSAGARTTRPQRRIRNPNGEDEIEGRSMPI